MSARIGVLALQGDFAAHADRLRAVGAEVVDVRVVDDLNRLDAVVLPGGESTTMSLLLHSSGLFDALDAAIRSGMAVLGTCAGLIMLGTRLLDGRPDQSVLGALDITVRRNGYGRQLQSFEVGLDIGALGGDEGDLFHGVFIRAPRIEHCGPEVTVLAEHERTPVLIRQGAVVGVAFHPELTGDLRIHRWFVDEVVGRGPDRPTGGRRDSDEVVATAP